MYVFWLTCLTYIVYMYGVYTKNKKNRNVSHIEFRFLATHTSIRNYFFDRRQIFLNYIFKIPKNSTRKWGVEYGSETFQGFVYQIVLVFSHTNVKCSRATLYLCYKIVWKFEISYEIKLFKILRNVTNKVICQLIIFFKLESTL